MAQRELEARLAALEAKITELQDIEDIRNLMYNYTYFVDYADKDKVMECFTDDCYMDLRVRGGGTYAPKVGRIEGKKAMKENVFEPHPGTKDHYTNAHMIANPVITLQGKTAKGTFYLIIPASYPAPEGKKGEQAYWDHGRYDMEFVKKDGKWKISGFRFLWNFHAPYEDGWVKTPMARG